MNKPIEIFRRSPSYEMTISWTIHNSCNYKCSYCPPSLHTGGTKNLDLERSIEFVKNIKSHYVDGLGMKNVLISFSGGEPTLWKGFEELCYTIGKLGLRMSITSNGSTSLKYWDRIARFFDTIVFSFHSEYADPDQYFENYRALASNRELYTPCARVMMHDNQFSWEVGEELINRIKKECGRYRIQAVRLVDGYDETPVERKGYNKYQENFLKRHSFLIKSNGASVDFPEVFYNYHVKYDNGQIEPIDENKLLNQHLCNFSGWSCDIGLEQLFVDDKGDIFRGSCKLGGLIGNIKNTNQVNYPTKPVVCNKQLCHCASDIRVSKRFKL